MKNMHIMIKFVEPALGTCNSNKDIHAEYIASKAPDARSREEEIAALGVDAVEEKDRTIFAKDDEGRPILWNYQIKGFFKEACASLQRIKTEKCASASARKELRAYKKVLDCLIEPHDGRCGRQIPLILPEGTEITILQRPLRAQTAQGERIALASSEMITAGTTAEFYVKTPDDYVPAVREWLAFGRMHGMSQWRNAGYGRFVFKVLDIEDAPEDQGADTW